MRVGFWSLFLIITVAGCATRPASEPPPPSADAQHAIRNQGYAILHQLMSDEGNVSKLLLIKKENDDLGALIKKIADTCAAAAKQIETYSKNDPHLHLQHDGLPPAEKETRDLIGKTRAKELISKSGQKFELRLLLTQNEALTYGAHLALVVQAHETDPTRQKFLTQLSTDLQAHHQSLIDLMHTRWQSPPK